MTARQIYRIGLTLLFFIFSFFRINAEKDHSLASSYTIEGTVNSDIINDHGVKCNIGLSGLRIRLYEKNKVIGETYTGEKGDFKFEFRLKSISTLKLVVSSETDHRFRIKAKNGKGVCKWATNITINNKSITKNIDLTQSKNADAFRSTHWANQAFLFFEKSGVPLLPGLIIKVNAPGSYFNAYYYNRYPVIHIGKGRGSAENSLYHEFGHFVMYSLQNGYMYIPWGKNGINAHYWSAENTGLMAFVEGWANAMQMILDAAHWEEDNEYGKSRSYIYENERYYSGIENGLRSEYYIANALYDLWDGAEKGLPEKIPTLEMHGWNDTISLKSFRINSWESVDDVELSLKQICVPLQWVAQRSDLKKMRNINDYYQYLINQFPDCKIKSDISRVFRENRVVWNTYDYEAGRYIGNLSSDFFYDEKTIEEAGSFHSEFDFVKTSWTDQYLISPPVNGDLQNIYLYAKSTAPSTLTDSYWIGYYNTEKKTGKKHNLLINPAANSTKSNPKHGIFQTCGQTEIVIRNGKLEIGGKNYSAKLIISENSTLKIEALGELIIHEGSTLQIINGGSLIIQEGAKVTKANEGSIVIEGQR